MIALYCITVSGLLLSLQHRAQRKDSERYRLSPKEIERRLDEESERLDVELTKLLREYRSRCEAGNHGEE